MSAEQNFDYPEVATYNKDGRRPLHELYNESYAKLLKRGWRRKLITAQEGKLEDGSNVSLPIYAFLSPKKTSEPESALWIIGGIHGEEPAPPNAFAQEIEKIAALPEAKIPVVAIFVANPLGYSKDWRYQDLRRGMNLGHSVGDSDHLLPLIPIKPLHFIPRKLEATSKEANDFTRRVLEICQIYKPLLVVNHHEDEIDPDPKYPDRDVLYSYAYGSKKVLNIICPMLSEILKKCGYKIKKDGRTRADHEKVKDGFVRNARDGSIDELLASGVYIKDFKVIKKNAASAVFVVETIIHNEKTQSVAQRSLIHSEIIRYYPYFWGVVKEN